jgi:radical SAM superfamily enzyme YgiQ (UPF0313 family)
VHIDEKKMGIYELTELPITAQKRKEMKNKFVLLESFSFNEEVQQFYHLRKTALRRDMVLNNSK